MPILSVCWLEHQPPQSKDQGLTRPRKASKPICVVVEVKSPTHECFPSSWLWKAEVQTSIGYARNGPVVQAGQQHGRGETHRKVRVTRPLRVDCWKDSTLFFGDAVSVLVLDRRGVAVMPCTQKRARQLLARGRARVHRLVPFVIRLVDVKAEDCALPPLSIKIDPGSKTTGMALVRDVEKLDVDTGDINQKKAALPIETIEAFLAKKPEVLKNILSQAKQPLKDAAAANTTLYERLQHTGIPVVISSGGRTQFNRQQNHAPKTHALYSVCVGELDRVAKWQRPTLHIQCTGRGSHQRTRVDAFGFPRGHLMRQKSVKGFATGEIW